jgi:oxygen-independent coproporphyrinogen-3 oxidase
VDSIYFGGGTPSYYGEKRLRELLATLKRRFRVAKVAEITLEATPDSVDRTSLLRLRRAGFNRLSLGMQSADDQQLTALHRPHTFSQVVGAVVAGPDRPRSKYQPGHYLRPAGTGYGKLEGYGGKKPLPFSLTTFPAMGSRWKRALSWPAASRGGETLPGDDEQAEMYLWGGRPAGERGIHTV